MAKKRTLIQEQQPESIDVSGDPFYEGNSYNSIFPPTPSVELPPPPECSTCGTQTQWEEQVVDVWVAHCPVNFWHDEHNPTVYKGTGSVM